MLYKWQNQKNHKEGAGEAEGKGKGGRGEGGGDNMRGKEVIEALWSILFLLQMSRM